MSARMALMDPVVLSHYALRRTVGMLALSLPFALTIGNVLIELIGPDHALPHPVLERSISDYYYTPMGNYLVGCLCTIGAFLICSRGYDLSDEIAGWLAGIFTLGVALFPSVNPRIAEHTTLQLDIQFAHTGFAVLMFLTLAYFCLFPFRRTSQGRAITRRKGHRNRLYTICGLIIVSCVLVMVNLKLGAVAPLFRPIYPLLCSESLALVAFGVAWLTKGEGLLRDHPQERTHKS